jgi:cyclopropane fatty-acyl-phospholipid synthase-like methyltransferase
LNGSDESVLKQRWQLQEMARSYRQSQILLTCVELGVFDVLYGRSVSAAQVAMAIGADSRAVELLLNAAVALELLEKRDSLYSNSTLTETHLTQSAAGGIERRLWLESAFYHRWGHLADAVRTGKHPEQNRRDEQTDEWVRTFIRGLYDTARNIAPFIADALALPRDQPLRVLDVGGGHGGYCIALAQRYPLLTATVFELPRVVPLAREIIAQAGMAGRVSVQEGDFQHEDLGNGYDVALLFGVLNGVPREKRPMLIRKIFSALNPGGQIVLREFVLDPDRASPPEATIFALHLLLTTEAGGLDTSDDWVEWLISAGFTPPQKIELPSWIGLALTISRKPNA